MVTTPVQEPVTDAQRAPSEIRPSSHRRLGFDVFFGIIAPLLCLYFDPVVLRGSRLPGTGLLTYLSLFVYLVIGASIAFLAFRLITRRGSAFLAGALYGGAFFAFFVGILILPLTLVTLLALIGIPGLTPFFTGYVFLRNARLSWRQSAAGALRSRALPAALLGAVLVLGVPLSFQLSVINLVNRATATLQTGSEQDFDRALQRLKWVRFALDTDAMARSYEHTANGEQRARLARAFHALTGQDIEQRLADLND
jgi:signal transduction histidine kinase